MTKTKHASQTPAWQPRSPGEGRCKGFLFDTEQYEGVTTVFDYRQKKDKARGRSPSIRPRSVNGGREWVQAVNGHAPTSPSC